MVNEKMLALGTKRSCIRELFEYGLKQAAIVGKENVFDYSLGNPSIPAPPPVNKAFVGIVEVAEPAAGELDLFKANGGADTKSELRIVEIEFIENIQEKQR